MGERKKEKGREERIKERSKPRREEEGGDSLRDEL